MSSLGPCNTWVSRGTYTVPEKNTKPWDLYTIRLFLLLHTSTPTNSVLLVSELSKETPVLLLLSHTRRPLDLAPLWRNELCRGASFPCTEVWKHVQPEDWNFSTGAINKALDQDNGKARTGWRKKLRTQSIRGIILDLSPIQIYTIGKCFVPALE